VTPSTVDLSLVRGAVAKSQPYYAVPSQYLALDDFPMTRNGKVDKRELFALTQDDSGKCSSSKRLSVRNGGVPFSPSLPGTPTTIMEQPPVEWTTIPLAGPSLGPVARMVQADPAAFLWETGGGEKGRTEGGGVPFVLEGVPKMVRVELA
jgi:hypothetical protein